MLFSYEDCEFGGMTDSGYIEKNAKKEAEQIIASTNLINPNRHPIWGCTEGDFIQTHWRNNITCNFPKFRSKHSCIRYYSPCYNEVIVIPIEKFENSAFKNRCPAPHFFLQGGYSGKVGDSLAGDPQYGSNFCPDYTNIDGIEEDHSVGVKRCAEKC